jgi:hypothetical protein
MFPNLELLDIQDRILLVQDRISQIIKSKENSPTARTELFAHFVQIVQRFEQIIPKLPKAIRPQLEQIIRILLYLEQNALNEPQFTVTKLDEIQKYCAHLQEIALQKQGTKHTKKYSEDKIVLHPHPQAQPQRSILESLHEIKQLQKQLDDTTHAIRGIEEQMPQSIQHRMQELTSVVAKAQEEMNSNPQEASKNFTIAST